MYSFVVGLHISILLLTLGYGVTWCEVCAAVDDVTSNLDQLNVDVQDLESEMDRLMKDDNMNFYLFRHVKLTIAGLEGFSCPRPWSQFQCTDRTSGSGHRCLPNHQVCDGTNDCPDGEDETDCDIGRYWKLGETVEFRTLYDRCGPYKLGPRGNHTMSSLVSDPQYPNIKHVKIDSHYDVVGPDDTTIHYGRSFHGDWVYSSYSNYYQSHGVFNDGVDYYHMFSPFTEGATGMKHIVRQSTGEECGRAFMWKI